MAQHEAARRHGHGDCRQHGRQQADEREKTVGAVEGRLHLRAARFERLDAHTLDRLRLDLAFQPGLILRKLGRLGGRRRQQQAVRHARAVLHQRRGGQVAQGQHHAGGEVQKGSAAVRLAGDQLRDGKCLVAQGQGVAQFRVQAGQNRRIDPQGARCRHLVRWPSHGILRFAQLGGDFQLAPLRVAGRDGLDGRQLRARLLTFSRLRHAGERHRIGQDKTALLRFGTPCRIDGLVGADDQVGPQQLVRVAVQARAQTVDEEAHGRQGRHGHDQGDEQETQLPGAPVAAGHFQGEAEHGRRVFIKVYCAAPWAAACWAKYASTVARKASFCACGRKAAIKPLRARRCAWDRPSGSASKMASKLSFM